MHYTCPSCNLVSHDVSLADWILSCKLTCSFNSLLGIKGFVLTKNDLGLGLPHICNRRTQDYGHVLGEKDRWNTRRKDPRMSHQEWRTWTWKVRPLNLIGTPDGKQTVLASRLGYRILQVRLSHEYYKPFILFGLTTTNLFLFPLDICILCINKFVSHYFGCIFDNPSAAINEEMLKSVWDTIIGSAFEVEPEGKSALNYSTDVDSTSTSHHSRRASQMPGNITMSLVKTLTKILAPSQYVAAFRCVQNRIK